MPVSRREVEYRLLPTSLGPGSGETEETDKKKKKDKKTSEQQGYWIKPGLTVRDKYFQKVLRVIPASEAVRVDAKEAGFLVWVPTGEGPDDGDE